MRTPAGPAVPVLVVALGLLAACSAAGVARGSGSDDITRAQIFELTGGTGSALTVIRQLRPRWLRARNPGQPSSGGLPLHASVFLDNQELGRLESLDGIPAEIIQRIEYLDMRTATIRYGEGYPRGIIRVITSTGRGAAGRSASGPGPSG